TPQHVAALVALVAAGTVSLTAAKEVMAGVIETGDDPAAVVEARGLGQMDDGELSVIVAELVSGNPDQAQQLRDGKEKVIGFFVGQAMKRTGGRADPSAIQRLVRAAVAGE
ncbi:MAG: Asp-tRNA(Asn)/Glu-tRNA(Gln) amidotransferase GatCAB subunit B, partial [Thermoleophilia bacterium]|nr:Asp-tRNA(Asn)/Glu-tRNA(Gln) amidotransferase GatCAB subunit B [Thermoleophilia bacterium]